jgi:phospholipid/cholesterol/gamma-HCH transport system substrate-binding protein
VLPKQPRGYNPADLPQNADHGEHRVPLDQCQAAIHGAYDQRDLPPRSLVPNIKDGVSYPTGKERPAPGFDLTSGYAGSASERAVVESIAAPAMGVLARQVPDVATLLFAPLARGAEVSVR